MFKKVLFKFATTFGPITPPLLQSLGWGEGVKIKRLIFGQKQIKLLSNLILSESIKSI